MDITTERKRAILQAKLIFQRETYYSYSIDAQIAKDADAPKMREAALVGMKRTKILIDKLSALLDELPEPDMAPK